MLSKEMLNEISELQLEEVEARLASLGEQKDAIRDEMRALTDRRDFIMEFNKALSESKDLPESARRARAQVLGMEGIESNEEVGVPKG